MSTPEKPSTQEPQCGSPRIAVCPLCREPVVHDDAQQAGECRSCRFQFASDAPVEEAAEEPSAAAMPAAEAVLEKWLSGAPWEPARPSAWRQVSTWIRRHRTAAASAAVLTAAAVACVVHLYDTCRTLEASLRETTFERDEALAQCDRVRSEAAEFARSVEEHVDDSFRRAERELRISIAQEVAREATDLATRQPEHGLAMATVALRMAHRESAPPIAPALELVYGLSTRRFEPPGEPPARVDVLAISPDGTRLATADAEGQVRLVELTDGATPGESISLPGRLSRATSLDFSADGLRLVARSADSTVQIWRLDGDDLEQQDRTILKVAESRMAGFAMSDDNRWILTGCNGFRPGETTVRLWDVAGLNPNTNYFDLPGNRGRVQSVAVSRDGRWVAAGNHGGSVSLWNTAIHPLRGVTKSLKAGRHGVNALAFTPDGRKLVTSEGTDGGECVIRVWDLTAGDPGASPTVLEGHVAPVRKLAITTNGRCLASADDTGQVLLWNLEAPAAERRLASLEAHVDAVTALAFGFDGRRLYSAGLDGQVCVWDLTRAPIAKPLVRLKGGESAVTGLAVSRDGRKLAVATADQQVRLWESAADDLLRWAHDGTRRPAVPMGAAPVVETKPAAVPPQPSRPIIETAERPDLNPLR